MWKIHLENLVRFGNIGYRMHVVRGEHDGSYSVMMGAIWQRYESNQFVSDADVFMDDSRYTTENNVRAFLQAMCDAAWEVGIYPKQLEDKSSELKATKYHLEDMRKLVLEK